MDKEIAVLIAELRDLEERLEQKLQDRARAFKYELHERRAVFEKDIREQHRRLRVGLMRFLFRSPLLTLLTAPVVYSVAAPIALLDIGVTIFQWICFPVWGMSRVKRSRYVVLDRHYLAYLNPVQKLNCIYCGYGNGVIAYTREVASRTEQYWCPIKHATRIAVPHARYRSFLDYGDADDFEARWEELRRELRDR